MKVLFCAPSAFAHLIPLVPLAGALQGAGHEVRVATHPEMTGAVRAMGLTAAAAGEWDFPKANAHESDSLYERVLELIGQGLTNPQIAERMSLSERAVKAYVSLVLAKLGVTRRAQAVARAAEFGDQVRRDRP